MSIKNDRKDDKLMWELLPLDDLEDVVKVYTEGAKKYGPNRWQNLENGYERYKAAAFRHILEYERGNEFDAETGCRHLAQAVWNLIACLHLSKQPKSTTKKAISMKEKTKNKLLKALGAIYHIVGITCVAAFILYWILPHCETCGWPVRIIDFADTMEYCMNCDSIIYK